MSNILDKNPLVFDTVGATSAVTTPVIINAIVWDPGSSGASADVLALHDASGGNLIFSAVQGLSIGNASIQFYKPFPAAGLYLTTMTHGKLLVYLA